MIQILIQCKCGKAKVCDGEENPQYLMAVADYNFIHDHAVRKGEWNYLGQYRQLLCPECSEKFAEHYKQAELDAEKHKQGFFDTDKEAA